MTWSARATVQDVSDGPRPIDVLATCNAGETYTSKQLVAGTLYQDVEVPTLNSNTEGKIASIELKIVLDEDSTGLKPGDTILITGHFDGQGKP